MADYTEIVGRTYGREGARRIVRTIGLASTRTDANRPKVGDSLSGESFTIPALCQKVEEDELRYPGRIAFLTLWESARTRAELLAGTP